ncbi:enhancer of rudimentary [Cunninghamella echinulata]|nr:enhancer of rudimentary [Cunninghamella echinulata]
MTAHTILLIQPNNSPSSRTYYDFETVALAMNNIATLYEQHLLKENPRLSQLQYRAEDLLRYIDEHKEFVALVFEPSTNSYKPHNQTWIKERLISHLSNQQRQQPSFDKPSQSRGRSSRRY